jgi:hypothetical protein
VATSATTTYRALQPSDGLEHRLAQSCLVTGRRELGGVLLDHLDGGAHQLDGLLQGDGSGQLARGGAEDLGSNDAGGVRTSAPGDERGDALLRDEGDPGAILGRHRAEPRQGRLDACHRLTAQRA